MGVTMNAHTEILTTSNKQELNKALCDAILADRAAAYAQVINYLRGLGADVSNLEGLNSIHAIYGYDLDIGDFDYEGIEPFFDPQMVSERTFVNNGSTTIEDTFSFEETTTDTFSYGFTQSLMVGATVSGKVNLPVVAGGEVSLTTSITLGANQQWTESRSRTWKDLVKVPVPANSSVVVRGFVTTASLSGTFTAKLRPVGGSALVCFKMKGNAGYQDVQVPISAIWTPSDYVPVSGTFKGGEGVGIRTIVEPAEQNPT